MYLAYFYLVWRGLPTIAKGYEVWTKTQETLIQSKLFFVTLEKS